MSKKVRKVNYELVTSLGADLKETLVTYDFDSRTYHYPVFIKPKDGYTNKDYLKEAKKIFAADLKSGQVFRSAKLVDSNRRILPKSKTNKSSKSALIATTCVLGAVAIALGGFLTYKYLNGGFGGGGGPEYKPGQEVEVNPQVNDPTEGDYKVTFSNIRAKVAEKFETTLDLIEKNPGETNPYYLPEKLVSVVSNKTVLKEEQYTYTLDAKTKKTATLVVPAENVSGPIVINLALEEGGGYEPGQEVEVALEVNDPSGCYKVGFSKPSAKVGEDYHSIVSLTKIKACDDTYVLPDKLVSIISNKTVLNPDKKQFTYTPLHSKTQAILDIPGKYVYGKTIVNLALTLAEEPEPEPVIIGDPREPLTFLSTCDSGEIDIHYVSEGELPTRTSAQIDLSYQIDDGAWTPISDLKQIKDGDYTLTIAKGIKYGHAIRFRGNNDFWSYYSAPFTYESITFVAKGSFVVGNNVMSLLKSDSQEFRSMKDLTSKNGCFYNLFSDENNGITDARGLWLQADKLAPSVYEGMFKDCKALKYSPVELPAETLDEACYHTMFYGCESLISTPEQISSNSAEGKLAERCCYSMFEGCSNLNETPALPSRKLADDCYYAMFKDCSSLKIAPNLPASSIELEDSDSWILCYPFMFQGCLKLEYLHVGFDASGTTLHPHADWPGEYDGSYEVTEWWLADAGRDATTKTFVWNGPKENLPFERSVDTIPNGWIIENPTL